MNVRAVLVSVALLLAIAGPAFAESLPTTGTFSGVYHQDLRGVGHFDWFIVHPDLHKQLARFDGKRIKVEVTKGEQPMNPGPAIMLGVGKVELLPQPPLEIQFKTRPAEVAAGQPFELVVEVANRSQDDSLLRPTLVMATVRQPENPPRHRGGQPWLLLDAYAAVQMDVVETHRQMDEPQALAGSVNFRGRGGDVLLPPGASYVWSASFPAGFAAPDTELKIDVAYASLVLGAQPGEWISQSRYETWRRLAIKPKTAQRAPLASETRLDVASVALKAADDEWQDIEFRLLPAQGKTVRVPTALNKTTGKVDAEKVALVARLEGAAQDGTPIELDAVRLPERDTPGGISQLVALPESGTLVRGRFRPRSRFGPPLDKVYVRLLTDAGGERLLVADKLPVAAPPAAVPFGPATEGVKLRIRPASPTFNAGQPLSFHLQAMNESNKPICWWRPTSGLGENIQIEIDGALIPQPATKAESIGGWTSDHTCANPDEWTFTLPENLKLAAGNHRLRYTITAAGKPGGFYKNASNVSVPLLRKDLASNAVPFGTKQ